MIGKTLAHYEITAQIGKGGMGEETVPMSLLVTERVSLSRSRVLRLLVA